MSLIGGKSIATVEATESNGDKPIFSIIGNHDLFFSGWDDFRELLGPSVYWFEVDYGSGRDLFIALDSASGTLGGKQMSRRGVIYRCRNHPR